jgi:hypothetical protein
MCVRTNVHQFIGRHHRGEEDITTTVSISESGSGGDEEGERKRIHRLGMERPTAHDYPDQISQKIQGIQI